MEEEDTSITHAWTMHSGDKAGRKLVDACLEGLRGEDIQKCHLFIFGKNELGRRFWNGTGWSRRIEIEVFSRDI
jgi:hypothetical protein